MDKSDHRITLEYWNRLYIAILVSAILSLSSGDLDDSLEGDKTVSGPDFSTEAEGRQNLPPPLYKFLIVHVEGGSAAQISSMTSSWTDSQSEWEGRDEEREVPLCLVCGWTMNSWVFGSISLIAKVSPSR